MTDARAGTPAESAAKIMGRACITLKEVLGVFPEAKAWVNPKDYEIVPFSPRSLYELGEHPWQYVLLPAIPCQLRRGYLNIRMVENFIKERFPAVQIDSRALYRIAAYTINVSACPEKWYLLSSCVTKLRFQVPGLPCRIESSLVYLYAWALFWRLRGKPLFTKKMFGCSDYYASKSREEVRLFLKDRTAAIGPLDKRVRPLVGKVPSVIPFNKIPPG